MSHPTILAFLLAGGKGERLFPLTAMRSKPAVPFGGRYRIVDFVLSNLINSKIFSIYLLVQYKSQSLIEHVRQNWVLSPVIREHFITVVPPQMRMGPEWFQGTADAVYQNLSLIQMLNPQLVLIFGSDHIYRMDVRQMIDFHLDKGAEITVAARPVPLSEAGNFGIIETDAGHRITAFKEKPREPRPMPGDPGRAYASMGNYIFSRDYLIKALVEGQGRKYHDFGTHIIPSAIEKKSMVFAYDFATNIISNVKPFEELGYWRDVGNIKSYFDAHMDMLGREAKFEVANKAWPIHPSAYEGAATKIIGAEIENSKIAEGVYIEGARIKNSVIRSGVYIERGVQIEDSIIMDDCVIKEDAILRKVIVDKQNVVEKGDRIGFDPQKDRFRCHIDISGIEIVPKGGMKPSIP